MDTSNTLKFLIRCGLAAILLTLLFFIENLFYSRAFHLANYGWLILSNLLTVLILGVYIAYSNLRGVKLVVAIFVIYFIISSFNNLIEAFIYNVTDRPETVYSMIQDLIVALIISPFLVYQFDKWNDDPRKLRFRHRSLLSWLWRVITGDFSYIVIYLVAGFILQSVYPQLLTFYKGKLPTVGLMIGTQVLRGFIFMGIAVMILKTSDISIFKRAVLVGLIFSVLGGIAPLIPPNEYMPAYIRLGHGFEVGISNFVYGLFISYLLGQRNETDDRMASGPA